MNNINNNILAHIKQNCKYQKEKSTVIQVKRREQNLAHGAFIYGNVSYPISTTSMLSR